MLKMVKWAVAIGAALKVKANDESDRSQKRF